MKPAFALLLAAFAVLTFAADKNELPADVLTVFQNADEVTLYSLQPLEAEDIIRPVLRTENWTCAGKVTLAKGDLKTVLEAIQKGVKDGTTEDASFGIPQYSLRATHDKQTVWLQLDLGGGAVRVIGGKAVIQTVATTAAPQTALERVLTAAKVPLPKVTEKRVQPSNPFGRK